MAYDFPLDDSLSSPAPFSQQQLCSCGEFILIPIASPPGNSKYLPEQNCDCVRNLKEAFTLGCEVVVQRALKLKRRRKSKRFLMIL